MRTISKILFRVAAGAFLLGGIGVLAEPVLYGVVSHEGERQMIDGPGVLVNGVCCVEPTWHANGRAGFYLGVLLLGLALVLAVLSLATKVLGTSTRGARSS